MWPDWSERNILITGGTGSFGQRFVKHVLKNCRPRRLVIFSRDELKQFEMKENTPEGKHPSLRYFIGDVRDKERLERAFAGVDLVVHAAALKQVPACEYNPFEAIQTNILGAKNIVDAALDQKVRQVIALSTDKAVNPVNLYGATKLCAEKVFVQANSYAGKSGTRFAVSRYGNVVGSRGSVLPRFMSQMGEGKLTVTDPRMTRFWITLDQGVEFVVQCVERMRGGEIFVPKIPSMKVVDLAQAVSPGCEIEEIGIRPGEKLHEALVSEHESRLAREFDEHYVIQPAFPWWDTVPQQGQPVGEGFEYRSDNNDRWLSTEDLRSMLMSDTD